MEPPLFEADLLPTERKASARKRALEVIPYVLERTQLTSTHEPQ